MVLDWDISLRYLHVRYCTHTHTLTLSHTHYRIARNFAGEIFANARDGAFREEYLRELAPLAQFLSTETRHSWIKFSRIACDSRNSRTFSSAKISRYTVSYTFTHSLPHTFTHSLPHTFTHSLTASHCHTFTTSHLHSLTDTHNTHLIFCSDISQFT